MATAAQKCTCGIENSSVKICSVRGIPVRVHMLLPLVMLIAGISAFAAGAGVFGIVAAVLINGPLLFLTVLVHELGHVFAAKRCGFVPDHILLWPLGGLAYIHKDTITPKQQIFVSICGPAMHVPMMLLWAGILAATNSGRVTLSVSGMRYPGSFVPVICVAMLVNNLAMLLFNLLVPCIPLDCSQILVSLMFMCGYQAAEIANVMVVVSVPVIVVMVILSITAWYTGSSLASLNLMLAFWLTVQTWQLNKARQQGQLGAIPLFAQASAAPARAAGDGAPGAGAAGAAQASGKGFQPFQGTGTQLGRPSAEVCAASALALVVNAALLWQMSTGASGAA